VPDQSHRCSTCSVHGAPADKMKDFFSFIFYSYHFLTIRVIPREVQHQCPISPIAAVRAQCAEDLPIR
jgi:hypothetical protein